MEKNNSQYCKRKLLKNIFISTISILFFFSFSTIFTIAETLELTQEELNYIAQIGSLRAASIDGGAPFFYKNSAGQIKGISLNILEEIAFMTGLSFQYQLYDSLAEMLKVDADIAMLVSKEYQLPKFVLSVPYLNTETILYYNSSLNPNKLDDKKYAMIIGGTLPEGIKEENAVYFNNREDTFDAVNEGKVDYGFANTYSLAFYTLQNEYNNIVTVPIGKESRAYCFGVAEGDESLLSIINKSIEAISESRMQTLILSAVSDVKKKLTFQMVLGTYWKEIFSFIFLVIAILSYAFHAKKRVNERLNLEIIKVKEQEEKIRQLSFHDSLTGLYNRVYLEEELSRLDVERQLPISVIVADVNGLKVTNDALGHNEGDKLLQRAAEVLKNACREEDIAARTGGDEFVIFFPQTTEDAVQEIARRIHKSCTEKCKDIVPGTLSIGYATKHNSDENISEVIKKAEEMMYSHKLLESQNIHSQIISSLQTTLHEKDIETIEHVQRIVEISVKVGEKLGLAQQDMDNLNQLARLYDIGKIAVDEHILKKSDKLTPEEMSEIKKHSEAGYRIAKSNHTVSDIAEYILYHHEHWDGKGYPHGLKGKEIPLLSRILAIADAYDAMTHDRPYKKAVSKEEAIEELKRGSGKQFDPKLIPLFISIL
ncbi:MAG: HD domain-containing phosphohydrolase [Atribacterota bacterium]